MYVCGNSNKLCSVFRWKVLTVFSTHLCLIMEYKQYEFSILVLEVWVITYDTAKRFLGGGTNYCHTALEWSLAAVSCIN